MHNPDALTVRCTDGGPLGPMDLAATAQAVQQRPWRREFVLLAAIWGASFMFTRVAVQELGPLPTTGLRVAIAAIFLLPLCWLRGQGASLRQHWRLSFSVGLLNSAIPFACFSYALLTISSGLTAMLNATVPLFGALIAWGWLRERPSATRLLGLVVGFVGVAMLAWDKVHFQSDAHNAASGWAVMACLLATTCYGLSACVAKRYMGNLPSLVSATGSQLGASLGLAPLVWAYWPAQAPSLRAWGCVLVLGVLCTGVAYVLYFRIIERAGPSRALSVTFAIPLFALFYGVTLLGERVSGWMLLCGGVIVFGTALSTGLLRRSQT
jgi:drug/metabolite transporter (DMT)-like permease